MATHFCILKKQHVCAHFHSSHSSLCWMNYNSIYLCTVKSHMVIFIILDSSKKKKKKTTQNEKNECWYNEKLWKKNNLSSIQWEVWAASTEQQNTMNVTYNINVHWFHNIKNQERSVIGLPAFACVWLSVLLRECLVFHQHARAFLVVHATPGSHHVCGNIQEAGRYETMREWFSRVFTSHHNFSDQCKA